MTSPKPPTLRQIISSILAALVGIQSEQNRRRDFSHGRLLPYVLVGGVALLLFIGTILLVVNWALSH